MNLSFLELNEFLIMCIIRFLASKGWKFISNHIREAALKMYNTIMRIHIDNINYAAAMKVIIL